MESIMDTAFERVFKKPAPAMSGRPKTKLDANGVDVRDRWLADRSLTMADVIRKDRQSVRLRGLLATYLKSEGYGVTDISILLRLSSPSVVYGILERAAEAQP